MNLSVSGSVKDSETVLASVSDMRSHIDAIAKIDPKIASEIEATWHSTVKAVQGITSRAMAARLILGGRYDKAAFDIVSDAGINAIAGMIEGKVAVPESIRTALGKTSLRGLL